MRQVITKILVPQGHDVFSADEGIQAFEICRKESPDLALMDIRLPDMDGGEILAGLKRIKPQLPVVILSGFGDVDAAAELVKQGGFEYISKPFKIDDFLALVRKALGQQQKAGGVVAPAAAAAAAPGTVADDKKQSRSRRVMFFAAGAAGLFAAAVGAWLLTCRAAPDAEFSIPYSNPAALCFDGKKLMVADWMTGIIYRHSADEKLGVEAKYESANTTPSGLAFDGKNIWTCSSFDQKIYKHSADPALSVLEAFPSPGPSPAGLYFDGRFLWSIDFQQSRIYKHDISSSLGVLASYDSPVVNPKSMFEYKGYFYIPDSKTGRLFKVNKDGFSVAGIYTFANFSGSDNHISVIARHGASAWICADGVPKIFRRRLCSLKSVKL